ncbi:reverse transcriptase [Gossypium australe]|uniref:Reverse transcriptase n=1 Tax=Gossypium australe TaxID=47621 RepID=A0A5B6WF30_9ROSI|nr:reverse transcriptase [Gossypium australe]
MSTISSSTMQVLWNGIPIQKFKLVRADLEHARILKNVLQRFREYSGHKVQNLGTYLGVPFLHDMPTNSTLNFVSWDARKLSIVGRVTLAQSVLLSTSNYFMQIILVPRGVYAEIECMVRQFICGCSKRQQKMALVGWDSFANQTLIVRELDGELVKIVLVMFTKQKTHPMNFEIVRQQRRFGYRLYLLIVSSNSSPGLYKNG